MGSQQQFCLRWNNHQSNLLNVFEELLEQETLVDVTLACEGLSLKAHKVVLSACSPYFQNLFSNNPCKHPIVILKDVKYTDLKSVVDFMYRGEINVVHDQLDALLKVADTLQVKGLAEVTENVCLTRERTCPTTTTTTSVANGTDRNCFRRTKPALKSNPASPPSPPPKRRKKVNKSHSSGGGGATDETSAHLQDSDESVSFPMLMKTESLPDLYDGQACSNASSDSAGGQIKSESGVEEEELSMIENAIEACEASAGVSSESAMELPYTNEHKLKMAATSSANASNLPADMSADEVDDGVYYPSTSLSAEDPAMAADPGTACAPSKESDDSLDDAAAEDRWTCRQCGREYDVYNSYMRHVKESLCSGNLSQCKICHKQFSRKDSLKRHYFNSHRSVDSHDW